MAVRRLHGRALAFMLLGGCGGKPSANTDERGEAPVGPGESCLAMLTCAAVAAPADFDTLQDTFGEDGSCWEGQIDAAACEASCEAQLVTFGFAALDHAACPSFRWTQPGVDWTAEGFPVTWSGDCEPGSGEADLTIRAIAPRPPDVTFDVELVSTNDWPVAADGRATVDVDGIGRGEFMGTVDVLDVDVTIELTLSDAGDDEVAFELRYEPSVAKGCVYEGEGVMDAE